jgi:hypothetical protein
MFETSYKGWAIRVTVGGDRHFRSYELIGFVERLDRHLNGPIKCVQVLHSYSIIIETFRRYSAKRLDRLAAGITAGQIAEVVGACHRTIDAYEETQVNKPIKFGSH